MVKFQITLYFVFVSVNKQKALADAADANADEQKSQ